MKIHVITIFPESFESFLNSSIIWNANKKWLFEITFYKLNDFSNKNFKHVDDKAYGMHWQVISPEPLDKAIQHIIKKVWKNIPIIYMSPKGKLLDQERVEKYYKKLDNEFIIICWHYEWIDQRIIDLYVNYEISIWNYVLSSWEIASQVFIDAIVRHIPWTLWNQKSLEEDSFSEKFCRQKEHPVYTRPSNFKWMKVPEILLSWNHYKIEQWKKENLS